MIRSCMVATFLFWSFVQFSSAQFNFIRVAPGGNFRTPTGWVPFDPSAPQPVLGPGDANDRAVFRFGFPPTSPYTISNVEGTNRQLIVENDAVVLELSTYQLIGEDDDGGSSLLAGRSNGDNGVVFLEGGSNSEISTVETTLGLAPSSSGSVFVRGDGGLEWNNSGSLVIGHDGHGNLIIIAGRVSTDRGRTATEVGSEATVEIIGPDSRLTVENRFDIGQVGHGDALISDGGFFSAVQAAIASTGISSGEVMVQGNGSLWMTETTFVADGGTGSMTIRNEGTVFSPSFLIADTPGSLGDVVVENGGELIVTHLGCGRFGDGLLTVHEGGGVISNNCSIGTDASGIASMAFVDGPDTIWLGTAFSVGTRGIGSLRIDNGAFVSGPTEASTITGHFVDSLGSIVISDPGTTWVAGRIKVSKDGVGFLTIRNGALVSSTSGEFASYSAGFGTGTVTGENTVWEIDESLSVGGSQDFMGNGGTGVLTISFGAAVRVDGDTYLYPDGTIELIDGEFRTAAIHFEDGGGAFNFTGGTLHVGTYNGSLINDGGILAPGQMNDSAGMTQINGLYQPSDDAILEIEIGGTSQGIDHDFVQSVGDTFLDGDLQVQLIDEFVPAPGQVFEIYNVSSGDLFDSFDNVLDGERLTTTGGEGSFLVTYGFLNPFPKKVILSDFQPVFILGDVNGDGEVDLLDVTPFVNVLSSGMYSPVADINMDGAVNLLDIAPFVELLTS